MIVKTLAEVLDVDESGVAIRLYRYRGYHLLNSDGCEVCEGPLQIGDRIVVRHHFDTLDDIRFVERSKDIEPFYARLDV